MSVKQIPREELFKFTYLTFSERAELFKFTCLTFFPSGRASTSKGDSCGCAPSPTRTECVCLKDILLGVRWV